MAILPKGLEPTPVEYSNGQTPRLASSGRGLRAGDHGLIGGRLKQQDVDRLPRAGVLCMHHFIYSTRNAFSNR